MLLGTADSKSQTPVISVKVPDGHSEREHLPMLQVIESEASNRTNQVVESLYLASRFENGMHGVTHRLHCLQIVKYHAQTFAV